MRLHEQVQEALKEISFPLMDTTLEMFQHEKTNKLQKSNAIRLLMCCAEEDQDAEYRILLEEIADLKERKECYDHQLEQEEIKYGLHNELDTFDEDEIEGGITISVIVNGVEYALDTDGYDTVDQVVEAIDNEEWEQR